MSDIVGTIVTVYDFLSVKECAIKIKNFSSQEVAFLLPENRHYIIPDFQREIRWKKENLIELMSDIREINFWAMLSCQNMGRKILILLMDNKE